jgi:hypothetical protein
VVHLAEELVDDSPDVAAVASLGQVVVDVLVCGQRIGPEQLPCLSEEGTFVR